MLINIRVQFYSKLVTPVGIGRDGIGIDGLGIDRIGRVGTGIDIFGIGDIFSRLSWDCDIWGSDSWYGSGYLVSG
jgi:hypothetical protein